MSTNKLMNKKRKILPVLIAMTGLLISLSAWKHVAIIPEKQMVIAYSAGWSCLLLKEIITILLKNRAITHRSYELQRLESMVAIMLLYCLIAIPYVTGGKTIFISGMKTSIIICLLCMSSVVYLAFGEIKSAKLLLIGIQIVSVYEALFCPGIIRDPLKCSYDVFIILFISELVIPAYIFSLLPYGPVSNLFPGNKWRNHIDGICNVPEYMRSKKYMCLVRLAQVLLCMGSALIVIRYTDHIPWGYLNIIISIVYVAVASGLIKWKTYNKYAVALPAFAKLAYDLLSNDLIAESDYFYLYIALGCLALFAALRGKRTLFVFSKCINLFVLAIDIMVCFANSNGYIVPDNTVMLALYGSELMLCIAILFFGICGPWSERLLDDLVESFIVPDEYDETPVH